jgi:hypothetical protein
VSVGRGSALVAAETAGGIDGNSVANPSGLSPWQERAVTLDSHFRAVDLAGIEMADAAFFTLHFGQPGSSGSGTAVAAIPPQHAAGPQQHRSEGPRTLQPQRRTDSPFRTTTG